MLISLGGEKGNLAAVLRFVDLVSVLIISDRYGYP